MVSESHFGHAIDVIHTPTGQLMTVFLTPQERVGAVDPEYIVTAYLDSGGEIKAQYVKLADLEPVDESEPPTRPD